MPSLSFALGPRNENTNLETVWDCVDDDIFKSKSVASDKAASLVSYGSVNRIPIRYNTKKGDKGKSRFELKLKYGRKEIRKFDDYSTLMKK
jgi:hypothetical protein